MGMPHTSPEQDHQRAEAYIAAQEAEEIRQREELIARLIEEELYQHQRNLEYLAAWEAIWEMEMEHERQRQIYEEYLAAWEAQYFASRKAEEMEAEQRKADALYKEEHARRIKEETLTFPKKEESAHWNGGNNASGPEPSFSSRRLWGEWAPAPTPRPTENDGGMRHTSVPPEVARNRGEWSPLPDTAPWPTHLPEPEPWIRGWSRNSSRPGPAAPPSPPPRVNPQAPIVFQPPPVAHFPPQYEPPSSPPAIPGSVVGILGASPIIGGGVSNVNRNVSQAEFARFFTYGVSDFQARIIRNRSGLGHSNETIRVQRRNNTTNWELNHFANRFRYARRQSIQSQSSSNIYHNFNRENALAGKMFYIDPGHGRYIDNVDPGAVYGRYYHEAALVLVISQHLKRRLEEQGATVHIGATFYRGATNERAGESDAVPYYERADVINRLLPALDMAVSIHLNSSDNPAARGVEILYDGQANNREIARAIHESVVRNTALVSRDTALVIRNNLHILTHTQAPIVMPELGFISNEGDRRYIINNSDVLARAVAIGIINYYFQ